MPRATDRYKLAGWHRRNASQALMKMIDSPSACETCGDIGYVIDASRQPANVPCPDCSCPHARVSTIVCETPYCLDCHKHLS